VAGIEHRYDSSDDNRDDNCSLNNGHHRPILAYRAWSRVLPARGSLGVRVARWRRRCFDRMVTDGLTVTVY
jgi:hypothetical protein